MLKTSRLGKPRVDRDEAIACLKRHEGELRQMGVMHAAIFGSVARNQNKDHSDIDVFIELDPWLLLAGRLEPRRVQARGPVRRAPAGDAVRLLHEPDRPAGRCRKGGGRDQVRSIDPAACAVAQAEQPPNAAGAHPA